MSRPSLTTSRLMKKTKRELVQIIQKHAFQPLAKQLGDQPDCAKDCFLIRNILQSISAATIVIDTSHKVVAWNHACENLTGIKREKVLGKRNAWKAFYPQQRPILADLVIDGRIEDLTRYYNKVNRSKHSDHGYTAEIWVELKGNKTYMLFSAAPIFNRELQVIGAIETIEDITDLKRTEEQLKKLAIRDPLTGLYNRRILLELLATEFERVERYGNKLAVAMLDFDHFKKINDTYGHTVGDEVLSRSAQLMLETLRKTDVCGRYGGEEFCILLSNTSPRQAELLLNRLRQRIKAQTYTVENKAPFSITLSVGIAEYDMIHTSYQQLLKSADDALYQAKKEGRDRIIVAGQRPTASSP